MKTKIKFILLFIINICIIQSYGQNAFYDAVFISNNLTGGQFGREQLPILRKYFPNKTDPQIAMALSTNPFLSAYFNPGSMNAVPAFAEANSMLSKIGNFDVTNLADGFAKFLVKRTKEELSAAYFEKLKMELQNADPDIQMLFPQTYSALLAIGDEIYNYQLYINTLRESFEMDLSTLMMHIPDVLNQPRYNSLNPSLKALGISSCYIGNSLLNKIHPGDIISNYDANTILNDYSLINVQGSVKTLQLISNSLKSKDNSEYWVSLDSFKELFKNPHAFKIYLGLIYIQAVNINFNGGLTLQSVLTTVSTNIGQITEVENFIKGFISRTNVVANNIKSISGKEDSIPFNKYYNLYSSTIDLIEYASQLKSITPLNQITPGPIFYDYVHVARKAGNIALDINRRNYSAAIINSIQMYQFIIDNSVNLARQKNINFLLRYGSFMAALTQAQNSDEVERAIEAAALPSGSSRIKRETEFSVSLNSYVGLYGGYESINKIENSTSFSYGVAAPVGVAISWGCNRRSYSLFLSLIDLGALASFRFDNDSISQVPSIQLEDIISPGAFFSYGIPKSPISLNIGGQVSPNLRKVGTESNLYDDNLYWRISFSVVVDIPVFNFYARPKD
jgi:hypothetical protein